MTFTLACSTPISTIARDKPLLLENFELTNPPLLAAKIIYENTIFSQNPKNCRVCGAKISTIVYKVTPLNKVTPPSLPPSEQKGG